MNVKYDTKEGIEEYLRQGIAGLHVLARERSDHHKRNGDQLPLSDWYLLGTFWFDRFGQVMKILGGSVRGASSVCTEQELRAIKLERAGSISMSFSSLPPAVEPCEWCRAGWTWQNIGDVEAVHDDETKIWHYYHVDCLRKKNDGLIEERLRHCIDDAAGLTVGLPPIRQVPNEYPDQNGPWLLLGGDQYAIVIGWRRRVIQISWDRGSLATDGHQLFADVEAEGITVGDRYVHAYGYEKAGEYLKRLLAAILASK